MSVFDSIGAVLGTDFVGGATVNPQYQPPQQRTWVGLTVMEAIEIELSTNHPREFAAGIEALLKEKNT